MVAFLCTVFPFFAVATPVKPRSNSSRTYVSNSSIHSLSQVKNPRWEPKQISTTYVYAAPFIKHNMPMPPKLQAALSTVQSQQDLESRTSLKSRISGETVTGSDGE